MDGAGVNEALFPSGPWTGFYNYRPGDRHRMDLELTFREGRIEGVGVDDVGRFVIRGRYDAENLECWWTKSYVGGHDVFYRGFREGRGIWGTWEITAFDHGGFHIWPCGQEDELWEQAVQAESVSAPDPMRPRRALPQRTEAGPGKGDSNGSFSPWRGQGCSTTDRGVRWWASARSGSRRAGQVLSHLPVPGAGPAGPRGGRVR